MVKYNKYGNKYSSLALISGWGIAIHFSTNLKLDGRFFGMTTTDVDSLYKLAE